MVRLPSWTCSRSTREARLVLEGIGFLACSFIVISGYNGLGFRVLGRVGNRSLSTDRD